MFRGVGLVLFPWPYPRVFLTIDGKMSAPSDDKSGCPEQPATKMTMASMAAPQQCPPFQALDVTPSWQPPWASPPRTKPTMTRPQIHQLPSQAHHEARDEKTGHEYPSPVRACGMLAGEHDGCWSTLHPTCPLHPIDHCHARAVHKSPQAGQPTTWQPTTGTQPAADGIPRKLQQLRNGKTGRVRLGDPTALFFIAASHPIAASSGVPPFLSCPLT